MTLSEIQRHFAELQKVPIRSLGQNFLHDQNLARWIVEKLNIQPGDHIIEIGPGLGALTAFLAQRDIRLTLIEKDGCLVEHLKRKFSCGTISIFHADALDFDLRTLWGHGPVKILSNLPYYISTPLIEKFTSALSPASRLVLTVQLELAERLNALPKTKTYGAMTVCVNRRWKTSFLRKLPASVFFPAPKVSSAIIALDRKRNADVCPLDEIGFKSLVRRGFSERRKQLRNLLPEYKTSWQELTLALGVPDTIRAEELSLAQWESFVRLNDPATAQSGTEMFDVVDANDQVLRSESRETVHVNNLCHRAVHIILSNRSGEILLQKRSIWKDRHPGLWDSSAAGHVDSGESYLQATLREFQEELGIPPPQLTCIGKLTPCQETGWEFIEVYTGCHEGPFVPNPLEVEAVTFFSIEHILAWTKQFPADFSPVFLLCLELMRKGCD